MKRVEENSGKAECVRGVKMASSSSRKAIVEMVGELWEDNPALRFGQLITWVIENNPGDLFYLPDENWIRILRDRLDKEIRRGEGYSSE